MSSSTKPNLIKGTSTVVKFSRVVDGDTIRIYPPGSSKDESVRILALDTEETYAGGSKPSTPWGRKASEFAKDFFKDATEVTIEFPGNDTLDVAFERHRGNFGRLLVFVYLDGVDYQEVMIQKGYSPYYTKYGNANFASHHQRYVRAEREAQIARIGVWDQVAVNGSVLRNYAALQIWWQLRARIIDEYRALKAVDASVYNTRLDYAMLMEMAKRGDKATIFTEVRTIRVVAGVVGLIGIGANERPFNLKIEDVDSEQGTKLVNLLRERYIAQGEQVPRRGYCYATGTLEMYRDTPQLVVRGPEAVTDTLDMRAEVGGADRDAVMTPVADEEGNVTNGDVSDGAARDGAARAGEDVRIVGLLPDPEGADRGNETVTLRNAGNVEVNLEGWKLQDSSGRGETLSGGIAPGDSVTVKLRGEFYLNNTGDEVLLVNPSGVVVRKVTYSAADVVTGQSIDFE